MKSYNSGKNHPKFINLTGKQFGELTIIDYVYRKSKKDTIRWVWECKCSCGNICYVRTTKFTKPNPQASCKRCSDFKFSNAHILPEYGSIKNRIYRRYKYGANARSYEFKLTFDEFNKLISQNCYYCNAEPKPYLEDKFYYNNLEPLKRNGIDRLNNNIGYIQNNVVPCCNICNKLKMDLSIDDFYKWIHKLYHNLNLKEKFND